MTLIEGHAPIYQSDTEKRIGRMNRLIDQRLRERIESRGDSFFKKAEVVSEVVQQFGDLPPKKSLDLNSVFKAYVNARLGSILQSTKDAAGLRVYENYADGSGERRWQRLRLMSAGQLRICIFSRERHIAAEEAVLEVYKQALQALEEAEQHGQGLRVGDVIDYVVEEQPLPPEEDAA